MDLLSLSLRWVIVLLFGSLVVWVLRKVLDALFREMTGSAQNPKPGVWIESNWGGLGGGLSGWKVSNSVVYLLLTAFLLGCLGVAVVSVSSSTESKSETASSKPEAGGGDESKKDTAKKDTGKEEQKDTAAASGTDAKKGREK